VVIRAQDQMLAFERDDSAACLEIYRLIKRGSKLSVSTVARAFSQSVLATELGATSEREYEVLLNPPEVVFCLLVSKTKNCRRIRAPKNVRHSKCVAINGYLLREALRISAGFLGLSDAGAEAKQKE
jgi:hypothetical protein